MTVIVKPVDINLVSNCSIGCEKIWPVRSIVVFPGIDRSTNTMHKNYCRTITRRIAGCCFFFNKAKTESWKKTDAVTNDKGTCGDRQFSYHALSSLTFQRET